MSCRIREYVETHRPIGIASSIVVGGVFLFSSVAKGLDPYGTVLKIGEYCHAMGIGWLESCGAVLAVLLIAFEALVGSALVVGAAPRLSSRVALLMGGAFTLFTLWVAIADPVAECGCFGDLLHLSNWQTFAKNVVLVALSVAVVWSAPQRNGRRLSVVVSLVTMCGAALLSLYSLLMLPLVERFPFGVGVDIKGALEEQMAKDAEESFVVCRNRTTGEERIFSTDDQEWWNESLWEFVRIESPVRDEVGIGVRDFRLLAGDYDLTKQILVMPVCRLLCVEDVTRLGYKQYSKLQQVAYERMMKGERIVVVTASPLKVAAEMFPNVECCNMDATALRALLRAPAGVVTIQRGVITQKINLQMLHP